MTTTIQFLQFGIIDDSSIVPLNVSFNSTEKDNTTLFDFSLVVPFFSTSFNYDPNFSVTLVGSGGDGGSNNLLPLLALIALVIPIFFLLLAVAVVVGLLVTRKIKQRGRGGAVNWNKPEEESDSAL